jgi:hypothetical protein
MLAIHDCPALCAESIVGSVAFKATRKAPAQIAGRVQDLAGLSILCLKHEKPSAYESARLHTRELGVLRGRRSLDGR